MDADHSLADLFPDFTFASPRSIDVTYPHIDYQLQAVRPRCFFRGRETWAYVAWEQRDFSAAWRGRLAPYDRLCALSRFAADAIAGGTGRPVEVLPCAVEVGEPLGKREARARHGLPADAFVIGFFFDAASSIERKNPWAVVEAVRRAFGDSRDVHLLLKVGSGERPDFAAPMAELRQRAASACRNVRVITDYLPKREVEALFCALDVYVSLHRSEGFGYTLAEAMLLGVPCVATRYSGNLDFMNDANSSLVDCREVVVQAREGPFELGTLWGEADLDHAAALLRTHYDDPQAAARRARAAAVAVADVLSPAAVARTLEGLLTGRSARVAAAGGGPR
jgi:glycosyltransferase involved in cell wall biosynthesis